MIIFRFTVKIGSNVETHYVRASNIERASKELSLHLNVPESTLRHNPKNIPFKVREKILNKVTEVIDGKEVSFKLTLDIKDDARNERGERTTKLVTRERVLDSHNTRQTSLGSSPQSATNTTEGITGAISKAFETSHTLYNTYRYDVEHLFKEDEEIIRKYAGDTNVADRQDIIDNTIRKRAYAKLRACLIRDNQQDKIYKNTSSTNTNSNTTNSDPVTLLEVLDAYHTNFRHQL